VVTAFGCIICAGVGQLLFVELLSPDNICCNSSRSARFQYGIMRRVSGDLLGQIDLSVQWTVNAGRG